jgi:signal recognition particle subunit SRP54
MASRILGMGDMLSLIEQAEREFDRDAAEEGAARLLEGRFTLEDFLSQLQQVKKLGPLGGVLSLMPGLGKELKQASAALDDGQVSQVEAIIRSMTPQERAEPAIVDGSRKARISRGSGTTTQEVNQLLRQFSDAQKLMRSPGMLKGLLGGGRSAAFSDALGKQLGEQGFPGAPGSELPELVDRVPGVPGTPVQGHGRASGAAPDDRARPGRSGKGTKHGKKKKGGRVTPKSGGSGRR